MIICTPKASFISQVRYLSSIFARYDKMLKRDKKNVDVLGLSDIDLSHTLFANIESNVNMIICTPKAYYSFYSIRYLYFIFARNKMLKRIKMSMSFTCQISN